MRVMGDSTTVEDIPTWVDMVAYYVDGAYAVPREHVAAAHPFKPLVGIATKATTNDGDILDVETGDATPDQAPWWVSMRLNAGRALPAVYCNRANRSAVELACLGRKCGMIVATLDGTTIVDPGPLPIIGVQYAGQAQTGGHYDLSVIWDDQWFGGTNMDQATASGFAKVAYMQAAVIKSLVSGQPLRGDILFEDVSAKADFKAQVDAMVSGASSAEDVLNSVVQGVGGVQPGGVYSLTFGMALGPHYHQTGGPLTTP